MNYAEKYKDPRWQKRRLQILDRDGFMCRACESTSKTLHVHHIYYVAGRDPWDYPDAALKTLCEDCHEYESNADQEDRPASELDGLIAECGAWSPIDESIDLFRVLCLWRQKLDGIPPRYMLEVLERLADMVDAETLINNMFDEFDKDPRRRAHRDAAQKWRDSKKDA